MKPSQGDSQPFTRLDTVLSTIRQHDAFAVGALVIVAVSGGSDSVALLHLLNRSKETLGIDLHVASLNHGIRAEAGQRDLEFVAGLASRWQLPYTVEHAEVPRLSEEWGIGIEEAARRARYAFLAQVAREQGSRCVAVGHHALDQAETMLMNIARGSGTRGLRGMQVVADMPNHQGIRLVRPLLRLTKRELETYCHEHNLPYRVDESNADIGYSRNFVRHEVISRLQRLNPEVLSAFNRLSESAGVDEDFITSQFEGAVMPLVKDSEDRWRIRKDDFDTLHPALQRRTLQGAFRQLSGASSALSHWLTLDLIAWAQVAAAGDRRDLSATLQMRMDYDALCIERKDIAVEDDRYRLIPVDTDRRIVADSPLALQRLNICLSPDRPARNGEVRLALPANTKLWLRTRRPGDRFKPKGMGGHSRKVKHWMIDRKIPREIRDRIPLICADGEIIAICLGDTWHLADIAPIDLPDSDSMTLVLA